MDLSDIPGIGAKSIASLQKAGIESTHKLITIYPRTYRKFGATDTKNLKVGEWVLLQGTITRVTSRHKGRLTTQVATFWDSTGSLTLRWFNMPYLSRSLKPSTSYLVMGRVEEFAGKLQIVSPQLRALQNPQQELEDIIVPIYSARNGLKPWVLRQKISLALDAIPPLEDELNPLIVKKYALLAYDQAIRTIHHPQTDEQIQKAAHRLAFTELYSLQLEALNKRRGAPNKAAKISISQAEYAKFKASLPFELTPSQDQAITLMYRDLASTRPMHRLLHGEVGSGKTVVAAALALGAHLTGLKTVIMAPTLILANQLFESIYKLTSAFEPELRLITSKTKSKKAADIYIGTQALLNHEISDIGLVIVDEEHRFGVKERENLVKGGVSPHFLEMTATPIPRSLAKTLFRHLDITYLEGIPKGRLGTKTYLVPEHKRKASYDWIKEEVKKGGRAFIVVPLIEEAEEQDSTALKSIRQLERELGMYLGGLKIDVMHGRLKEEDKLVRMQNFKTGTTQVLVATSMIEVGIDVPEANIIVIEDAERFGLAELHQLRGRVGRGVKEGHCLLFTSSKSDKSLERLAYFLRHTDGAQLARYDLEHRGPGELFGTTQSGFFNLSLGNMYDDKLLEDTYQAAKMALQLDKS